MISIPQRRDPTDEFLQDNGLSDVPTGTTVVDNGDSSIIINNNAAEAANTGSDANNANNANIGIENAQVQESETGAIDVFEDPWATPEARASLDAAATGTESDNTGIDQGADQGTQYAVVDMDNNTIADMNVAGQASSSLQDFQEETLEPDEEPDEMPEVMDGEPAGTLITPVPEGDNASASQVSDEDIHELFNTDTESLLDEAAKAIVSTIPENTVKHVNDEARVRFSDATWFKKIQESTVILAGLGGIGSYVLYCLSKMNPKQIFIYDDDDVEMVNLAGQLYSKSMIGFKKVDSMAQLAEDFSDYHGVQAIPQKFTKDTPASDIMICGFDNMEARKLFYSSWRKHVDASEHPEKCLYLDGRLSAEEFQVFCITGDDRYSMRNYESKWLFADWKAEEAICSYKQTAFCANMIGSVITNLFVNFIANQLDGMPRSLPYFTYYDASMMILKTVDDFAQDNK